MNIACSNRSGDRPRATTSDIRNAPWRLLASTSEFQFRREAPVARTKDTGNLNFELGLPLGETLGLRAWSGMNSNRNSSATSKRASTAGKAAPSAAPTSAPSTPFVTRRRCTPYERDPRTPEPPKWDGSKDRLPQPLYLPVFKNYQFRYGAYPGFRDCSKNPPWPDGAVSEHARRQEAPVEAKAGRAKTGRTTFKPHERVCGDLQFGKPAAKKAHEFVWFNLRDPNQFDLKPPRRWDPAGVKKIPPRPFFNREDGHFLLNNTCTITNLFLLPELRRLQCYFFPKLPKIRAERNFYLPIKKIGRQKTRWRWTETWKRQLIPWYSNYGPEEPEIAEFKAAERRELDFKHTRNHYRKNRESIERLRTWHRRVKVKTPPPKPKPIDYGVPVGRENLRGVRKVKELFEDPILGFWLDPLVDIVEILRAEAAERKRLEEEAKRKNPTPPPPPSICDACDYFGDGYDLYMARGFDRGLGTPAKLPPELWDGLGCPEGCHPLAKAESPPRARILQESQKKAKSLVCLEGCHPLRTATRVLKKPKE